MDSHACQPVDNPCKEQGKTQLGFFKPCIGNPATANELHQYLRLFTGPRRQLANNTKRKQHEI